MGKEGSRARRGTHLRRGCCCWRSPARARVAGTGRLVSGGRARTREKELGLLAWWMRATPSWLRSLVVVLRWPAGSSDERRGDEVRRRSGTCPLDRGLEELLSFGAGHAREPGEEAVASSGERLVLLRQGGGGAREAQGRAFALPSKEAAGSRGSCGMDGLGRWGKRGRWWRHGD